MCFVVDTTADELKDGAAKNRESRFGRIAVRPLALRVPPRGDVTGRRSNLRGVRLGTTSDLSRVFQPAPSSG